MLHRSFKPEKCKTSLRLAMARIKLCRNRREVQLKQMRREIAQLIENGQDQTAKIRVEHVIREEKTMAAYELIELFCELLVARLQIIEPQKHCPIDLKEAVASVIFASPRCSDIPELMDVRKHFAAKFGKDFTNSALETRPDCGVSRLVVEKLSARAPDTETKVKTLKAIAEEHSIKWDPKSFEDQLQKPHEDLLNVPSGFASASKNPIESSSVNSTLAPAQTYESSLQMPQADGSSVPFNSQTESRTSGGAVSNLNYRNENSTFDMEFQDATSAAQAAAESAERASMAARAAAKFASRENMSSQSSTRSKGTPTYNKKYERPEKLREFLDDDIVKEPVPRVNDEPKSSQGLEAEEQSTKMNNILQGRQFDQLSSNSIQDFINDDKLYNFHEDSLKDYVHAQNITSGSEAVDPSPQSIKYDNNDIDDDKSDNFHEDSLEDYVHAQNITSGSEAVDPSPQSIKYDNNDIDFSKVDSLYDEKFWKSNIFKHGDYADDTSKLDAGKVASGRDFRQSTSNDSPAVVFDDYSYDDEDTSSVWRNKENLLDRYQEVKSTAYQSNNSPFSDKNRSESFAKSSDSKLHLFKESQPEELSNSSQANASAAPSFDVSDEESTDIKDEVVTYAHKETPNPTNMLHKTSTESSFSDDATRESNQMYMGRIKEVAKSITKADSGPYERNNELDLDTVDKFEFSSSGEEEPQPLRLTKRTPKKIFETPSTHLDNEGSEASNYLSDKNEQGINFGLLSGGLKHKGFPRPPYVKSSTSDDSPNAEKLPVSDHENNNQGTLPKVYSSKSRTKHSDFGSPESKKEELAEIPTQELYQQKPQKKIYKEVHSSYRGAYTDPDTNEREYSTIDTRKYDQIPHLKADKEVRSKMDTNHNAGSRVNANVKLSRRTRDVPAETKHTSPNVNESKQKVSSFEESSKSVQNKTMDNVAPTNSGNTKSSSSSVESMSREDSLKKASHTHPKLPDYDSFAAHFHALRSNRR